MSEQQLDSAIQAIVNRIVQVVIQVYAAGIPSSQRGERDERDERGQSDEPGEPDTVGNSSFSNKWNAAELKFFDFLYDGKSVASEASSLKHAGKNTYFRNLHAFIDRVKECHWISSTILSP